MKSNFYKQHPIDSFITNETDNIIDLFYDLEYRFPYMFNNMRSSDLMCFIIDNIFQLPINQKYHYNISSYFEQEYNNEINIALMLINNYLLKFKNCNIQYDDWLDFISIYN